MRFSVIIPAYQAVEHIRKAIESITSQTFKDFELIVVCDRCTDGTHELVNLLAPNAIIKEVDFGRDGLTRNAGLDIAQGEYILFLDDDDFFLHEFVFEQIDRKLKETNDPELLCFSFIWKGVMYSKPLNKHGEPYVAVWCKAWRRDYIGDTRFPDVYSVSDSYFHADMMKKPHRTELFDNPMVYYNYLRKGSISANMHRTYEGTRQVFRRQQDDKRRS